MTAYPEWLSRGDDSAHKWSVRGGQPHMALTDVGNHTMVAPGGDDPVYRGVRMQQLIMAKVAPKEYLYDQYLNKPEALQAAQKMIINRLLRDMGEDLGFLHTGAEYKRGQLYARNGQWNSIITELVPIHGTSAGDELLAGIREVNPEWASVADRIARDLHSELDDYNSEALTNTQERSFAGKEKNYEHPWNWTYVTDLADRIEGRMESERLMEVPVTGKGDDERPPSRGGGRWATMSLKEDLPLEGRAKGVHSRKPRASDIGRVPRNISRLLFDPQKRIFGQRRRDLGGVVLIDQSGSMQLSNDDLWAIINVAPGATIIGYSHMPGYTPPNVWVLAEKGRVVKENDMPHGGRGNCVDGPALMFAASKRRNSSDPFIWICDGVVTDLNDQCRDNLTQEAIAMAHTFGVHMCEDMDTAMKALAAVAKGRRLGVYLTGPMQSDDPNGRDYPPRPYISGDDHHRGFSPDRYSGDDDETFCCECGEPSYGEDLCSDCYEDDEDDDY